MTSNNHVSPVIRILRGERDATARATHLRAASKKYLETTIERKQMSTTTKFKRIALLAVAALGLGVLSSVPTTAALTGAPAGNTALPTLRLVETSSAFVDSAPATNAKLIGDTVSANTATIVQGRSATVVTTAKYAVYLTQGGNGLTGVPSVAGTYTVKITPATVGTSGALQGYCSDTYNHSD